MNSLSFSIGDGLHGTPIFSYNDQYYFINGSNLLNGKISLINTKTCSYEEYMKYSKPINKNTIFISINGTLGNLAIYNDEIIILGKSAAYITLLSNDLVRWIFEFLKSDISRRYFSIKLTGSTIKNIPLNALRTLCVAIPPINEQQRIIDKLRLFNQLIEINL